MILAVLVLYQQRLQESQTFVSLFEVKGWQEKIHLVVYDNSPKPVHTADDISRLEPSIRYVSDPSNPGLAAAYDQAVRMAKEIGDNWLLFLDQDTSFPPDALSIYLDAVSSADNIQLFCPILKTAEKIYSPCRYVSHVGLPLRRVVPGPHCARGRSVLNSGRCVSIDALARIGPFDQSIPLDFADHDFFLKYRERFPTFAVLDIVCEHGFSNEEKRDVGVAIERFAKYCTSAKQMIKSHGGSLSLISVVSLHALHLSLRYHDARFFGRLIACFLRK